MNSKFIEFLNNDPVVSGCLQFGKLTLKCLPCNIVIDTKNTSKNFKRSCLRHFQSAKHIESCCWSVKDGEDRGTFVRTMHKTSVSEKLSEYYQPVECKSFHPMKERSDSPEVIPDTIHELPHVESADHVSPCESDDELERFLTSCSTRVDTEVEYKKTPEKVETCKTCNTSECPILRNFFVNHVSMSVPSDFCKDHVKDFVTEYPLIKAAIENGLNRRVNKKLAHHPYLKQQVVKSALKHNRRSATEWSSALGGPSRSTIDRSCRPEIQILPYLDEITLELHFIQFRRILAKSLGIPLEDTINVPVIASMDATSVTGRMNTTADKLGGNRLLYGLQTDGPFQSSRISLNSDSLKEMEKSPSEILVHGYDHASCLIDRKVLTRATQYMAVILLPLVEKPKPYCLGMYAVGKGMDHLTLRAVHKKLKELGHACGIRIISFPGDGDSVLRAVQLYYYPFKRSYAWLTQLVIPVQFFFDSVEDMPAIGMQDVIHNLKKLRNNVLRIESRCLALGFDKNRIDELTIRWDMIYKLLLKRPELLVHSGMGAVVVRDLQDPSLVADISSLWKHFIEAGFTATGLYFKAVQYLCEAFMSKTLSPEERITRAWYVKTFLVTWSENHNSKSVGGFISSQTFRDVINCCDGLVLYIAMLMNMFPDSPIVPYFFTSDVNEQSFATVRVGRYAGRRTNLDALTLAQGLEQRNVLSDLSDDDPECYAHTRNRSILKAPIPLKKSAVNTKAKPGEKDKKKDGLPKVWLGKEITRKQIIEAMKKGTKECIDEFKKYNIPYFSEAEIDKTPRKSGFSYLPEDSVESDTEDVETVNTVESCEDEEESTADETEDTGDTTKIKTKKFGVIPARSAATLLLNKGRYHLGSVARQKRFYKKMFLGDASLKTYESPEICKCPNVKKIGDKVCLKTKTTTPVKVTGVLSFVSRQGTPAKHFCGKCHKDDTIIAWLYCVDKSGSSCFQRCTP